MYLQQSVFKLSSKNSDLSSCRVQWIQIDGQAQTHYFSQLTQHCFKEWRIKLMERRAVRFRQSLLLVKCYRQWSSRQTLVQCNKIAATKFHCQVSQIICSTCTGSNTCWEKFRRLNWQGRIVVLLVQLSVKQ